MRDAPASSQEVNSSESRWREPLYTSHLFCCWMNRWARLTEH